MLFSWNNPLKALPVLLLVAAYAGAAFGAAGNVQFVIGDAKLITKAGVTRALQKGAEINEGDRVVTADAASAQIKMVDGGFIAIRPNTDMSFDTYRYSGKEDGNESAIVSLVQGGFRTITGFIGRTNKQNYLVKTATATIGIRGTDHEPMVILAPLPGQAAIAAAGTYDKVNVGVAYIRTDAGSVDIQRNQVGFAPDAKTLPLVLPKMPPFYKPTPAPAPQKAKEETKDEGKKETAASAPAPAAKTEQAAAAPAEKAAEPPAQIRSTAVVDPTSVVTTAPAATPVPTTPAANAPSIAITATGPAGGTLNTTTQTVTTADGVTVPVSDAGASAAQSVADQALASYNATQASVTAISAAQADANAKAAAAAAIPPVSLAPATSAISTAQAAITPAQSAVSAAQALTPASTTTATANATTSASVASAATSQASTATTKFNANGSFADATIAVPAFSALNSANTTLQTANTGVQKAAGVIPDPNSVTAQNAALTASQTAAAAALTTANTSLSSANTATASASSQNAALATAQSTANSASSSIPGYLSTAQAASSAAQAAAQAAQVAADKAVSLQSKGDANGAQAQLAIAQQQQAIAQQQQVIAAQAQAQANSASATTATQLTAAQSAQSAAQTQVGSAVTSANSATTSAGTASSSAASAQTVKTSADAAVATTASGLATVQSTAPTVQQNSVLAQYSNPAVASSNFTDGILSMKPVAGGAEHSIYGSSTTSANTNYVLDGNKSLVEIRNIGYERFGWNYPAAMVNNADITFTGGTAKDLTSDPNGVYYFGRWQGGQVNVKDLAATGAVAPFSDALGATNVHWLVGLVPGNSALSTTAGGPINNTQLIVGTANYSLAAATHPTDALGNVGTLNSATLTANFSSQTLNAALGLSFSSTDPVNVSTRNLSISASANNVPIQGTGFDAFTGLPYAPVINCTSTSGGCAAGGYVGSISGAFLSTASGGSTTGAVGTGAALGYSFTPNIASPAANQPFTDLIQGIGVLSTSAAPAVGVSNFSSTAVLRNEVLWTTTQVAPGANPAVTTYVISDKNKETLSNNLGGTPASPVTISGPTNNTNYLFDASGNLVRVFDTPHVVFDLGNDVAGSSTQFAAPNPLAHAQLSFGGGGATAESYFDPTTSIRLGRWTGGVVDVTDLSTGSSYVESLVAPGGAARSLQWVVAQMPSSLPLTGLFQYTRINGTSGTPSFATAPTDSYGNVGTIEGARISADFTNQRVSAGVRISMPSGPAGSLGIQNLSSRFDNAPISSGGFNVSSGSDNPVGTDNLHISCAGAGCAPDITTVAGAVSAYSGRIRGAFTSATGNAGTADGAFMRYTFNTLYGFYAATPPAGRVVDDYINGLVAFQQGPQVAIPTSAVYPAAAPTGPSVVVANYGYNNGSNIFTSGQTYWVDKPAATNPATSTQYLVTDTAGNLVSLTEDNSSQHGNGNALALSGGTANPATPLSLAIGSTTTATDGTILLGWQQPTGTTALTVSGSDYSGCYGTAGCTAAPTPRTVLADGLSWARGPAPFPDYLPGAIAGYTNSTGVVIPSTATYNLGASILHDQAGAVGTVNSAALTANFNNSSVSFNMAATTAAGNWTATTGNIRMSQDGSFFAGTGNGARTITSGTTIAPAGLHDGMSVVLTPTVGTVSNSWGNIQGQLMGIGVGGAGVTYDLNSLLCIGTCNNVTASGALAFALNPAQQPYSTLTPYQLVAFASGMNAAGQVDSAENNRIQGGFVSPYRTQTVNNFPVKIDGELPVVVTNNSPPCTVNCGPFVQNIPAVFTVAGATGPASIGTATLLESGYDIATGIRWGRYGGGTIGVNDRISGASLGTLDATTQNVHFLMTTAQSAPTVLPITGTFNYTFAGGTTPTDSNGNVGTPLTSANASLTANFSTQKVDATLSNIVVGGNTWGASATGMPIQSNVFQADKKLGGGGNLTVTSTLGTNTAGSLAGVFTGATGNGVGMLYSLNHGGNLSTNAAAVTVSGVAVFKR